MKTGSILAIVLLTLVALAHLLRILTATEVTVGVWSVPQWVSAVGIVIPGLVAWLLWTESRS